MAKGIEQCRLCLEGHMQHVDALCRETHTPWKNCGVDCCVELEKPEEWFDAPEGLKAAPQTQIEPDGRMK